MTVFGTLNYSVLLAYFGLLLWMGYRFSLRQQSTADYFRGKGRVPWWAAGISIFGTLLSAITFMAVPAKVYATDWSYFMYNMTVILLTPLIVGLFIPFYRKLDVTTAYEYLEERFNAATRMLASAFFMIFQLGRIAVILLLPSIAISVVSGADVLLCILTVGVVSIAYTHMGGIEAVIWTDVLQVAVLTGGALLAITLIAASFDGGVTEMYRVALDDGKLKMFDFSPDWSKPTFWVVVAGGLGASLISYGTDQTVVQRYMTATNLTTAKRMFHLNAIAIVPATCLFFTLGTALYLFYQTYPERLSGELLSDDAILPWFILNELPDGLSGLLIAAIFSAAMSSLSSSINSSSAAYVTDFHRKLKPEQNDLELLKVARFAALAVGVFGTALAVWMAVTEVKSLWDRFITVLGLFTGGVGGLFLLGMTTTRVNAAAAMAGLGLSGVCQLMLLVFTSAHPLLYATTGILSCYICGYLASFLPRKRWPNKPWG